MQVPARAPILGRPPSAVPAIQDKPHALQNMILDGDMLLPTNRGSIGQFISGRPGILVTISVSIFKTQFICGLAQAFLFVYFFAGGPAACGALSIIFAQYYSFLTIYGFRDFWLP